MSTQPIAANILGTAGTVCWCVQLVPQIWRNHKTKDTKGLPALMLLLWAISAIPFGVYAILQNLNIPIQIQPQIFGVLSLITYAQCLHYQPPHYSVRKTLILSNLLVVSFGSLEVLLILTLRPVYARGVFAPITVIGVIAATLLAAGLLPPYQEIRKRRGRVVGFSFLFLGTDWMGAFLSLMSLVAQREFDVLGGVMYIVCLALETGIFACQAVWLVRSGKWRKVQVRPRWWRMLTGAEEEEEEESTEEEGEVTTDDNDKDLEAQKSPSKKSRDTTEVV